jgi:hypothetical protein
MYGSISIAIYSDPVSDVDRIRSAVSLRRCLLMPGRISESPCVLAAQLSAQHGKPITAYTY